MPRNREVYVVISTKTTATKRGSPQSREAKDPSGVAEIQAPRSKRQKRSASPILPRRNKRKKRQPEIRVGAVKPERGGTAISKSSLPRTDDSTTREARLRSEPYAEMKSPTLVVCRLCGVQVTMSDKEKYGLSKWNRHRKRCKVQVEEKTDDVRARSTSLCGAEAQLETEQGFVTAAGHPSLKPRIKLPGRRTAVSSLIERPDDIPTSSDPSLLAAQRDELATDRPIESDATSRRLPQLDEGLHDTDVAPVSSAADQDEDQQTGLLTSSVARTHDREGGVDRSSATPPHEMNVEGKSITMVLHTPVDVDVEQRADDQLPDVKMGTEMQRIDDAEACVESQLFDDSQSGSSPDNPSLSPELTSEFDFEYPDWVPPSSSGSFEHEIRSAGMTLENIVKHFDLARSEGEDSTGHCLPETLQRSVRMTAAY